MTKQFDFKNWEIVLFLFVLKAALFKKDGYGKNKFDKTKNVWNLVVLSKLFVLWTNALNFDFFAVHTGNSDGMRKKQVNRKKFKTKKSWTRSIIW